MRKITPFLILIVIVVGVLGLNLMSSNLLIPSTQAKSLENPLGKDVTSPEILLGRVLKAILGLVGSLALLMFVFGGITWMTSSGNSEKVKKGRDILIWSAIGLLVVFSSYAIVRVILLAVGVS